MGERGLTMVHVDTAQRERFEFWQRLNDHFLPAKNHRNHGYNGFSNGYHQEEPLIPAESAPLSLGQNRLLRATEQFAC